MAFEALSTHPEREAFLAHPMLRLLQEGKLGISEMEVVLHNWWVILEYFPKFLSSLISRLDRHDPHYRTRSRLACILSEELGIGGNHEKAHPILFRETMCELARFPATILRASTLAGTLALLDHYERTSRNPLQGIGTTLGTELVDADLVLALGKGVEGAAGIPITNQPWVRIHYQQEPGHRQNAYGAVEYLTPNQIAIVETWTVTTWRRWGGFFTGIQESLKLK